MKVNFRRVWQYSLLVAMLMIVIGIATGGKDVDRYADRMEALMADGRYEEALQVGIESDKTDARLMLLRIRALAHERQLGDRLFQYPVVSPGIDLYARGGDEALCGCLIDRDLERFAELLPQYYAVTDSLPRYYREALILYNHQHSQPRIIYHDSVLDTDYADLQQLERAHPKGRARQMAVFSHYEDTYWYYYDYPSAFGMALLGDSSTGH